MIILVASASQGRRSLISQIRRHRGQGNKMMEIVFLWHLYVATIDSVWGMVIFSMGDRQKKTVGSFL